MSKSTNSGHDFDLIVIGAGSGGVRASRISAGFGKKVAVIEKSRVGGTCVMRGCVPKKLLVQASHFSEDFEDSVGFGWTPGSAKFDWQRLIANKNQELDRLEGIYHNLLSGAGVEEIAGTGRVIDGHTVEVNGQKLDTAHILIATGGWPSMPQIPGIEHVITSNEALDLLTLPKRIVIVGGGYIAVEFAGIFNAVGVETHIIIRADNILRGFDEDVRATLREEMEKKGITVHSGTVVNAIEKKAQGYTLILEGQENLDSDLVMYATGRAPASRGVGLEEAGVEMNGKGAIKVNDQFQTSVKGIYAIGDVTDRVNLTPVAIAEGMILAQALFGGKSGIMDYNNIASAVFSQPPIGTVGLTEEEARARGPVDVYVSKFKPMKHTLSGRDEKTLMKLIVDQKTDRVLGCHMVGPDSPEIAQGLGIALKCGATKAQFDATIGIHPTAAEEFVTMREKRPD